VHAQRNFLKIIGGRFGEMDEALERAHTASRKDLQGLGEQLKEQLGELTTSVRRLEDKLDRNMTLNLTSEGPREGHNADTHRRKAMAQHHSAIDGGRSNDNGKVRSCNNLVGSAELREIRPDFTDWEDSDPGQIPQKPARTAAESPELRLMDVQVTTRGLSGISSAAAPANTQQVIQLGDDGEEGAEISDKKNIDRKLDGLDEKLESIACAVGARTDIGTSEEEDRRRLKEKLKEALESAARNSVQEIDSEREVWLEYIFGICKPNGRIGKAGSRYSRYNLVMLANN
jgi:hypothetical protein